MTKVPVQRRNAVATGRTQAVHFGLKQAVLEYVASDPIEAVRLATGGAVELVMRGPGEYETARPFYGEAGGGDKGKRLRFWLNRHEDGTWWPAFACGKEQGSFIRLVQLVHTLEEDDDWRYCADLFRVKARKGTSIWPWRQVDDRWHRGLELHRENVDQVRADFDQVSPGLSDEFRLRYAVTPDKERKSFLAAYYDAGGELAWLEEHSFRPVADGQHEKWTRYTKRLGEGKGGKFVGALHPSPREIPRSGSQAVVTVHAWEADQLRERGIDAYAVPSDRCLVPDPILRQLGKAYGRLVFLAPAGKAGTRWAKQGIGQCRKLGGIRAEIYEWPEGTPDGYTVCRAILDRGEVSVDTAGNIEVLVHPSVEESSQLQRDARMQRELKAFSMIHNLISHAPVTTLSQEAKLVYTHLLGGQAGGSYAVVDYELIQLTCGIGEKRIKAAMRELQNWSLITKAGGRGRYHVVTKDEIPPGTLEKLFLARVKLEQELRERRHRTTARVLNVVPIDDGIELESETML